MAAKLKQLVSRTRKKTDNEDTEILVPAALSIVTDEYQKFNMEKDCKKHNISFALSQENITVAIVEPEKNYDLYKQITCNLSKEMRNFLPSPEMMRRKPICEEIEKHTPADTEGNTLRDRRVQMLKADMLKEMGLI